MHSFGPNESGFFDTVLLKALPTRPRRRYLFVNSLDPYSRIPSIPMTTLDSAIHGFELRSKDSALEVMCVTM